MVVPVVKLSNVSLWRHLLDMDLRIVMFTFRG
jgi:hypothetical protein